MSALFHKKNPIDQKILKDAMRSIRQNDEYRIFNVIDTKQTAIRQFSFNFYKNIAIINGTKFNFIRDSDSASTVKGTVKSFTTKYQCHCRYSAPDQIRKGYIMSGKLLTTYDTHNETNECNYVFTLSLKEPDTNDKYTYSFSLTELIGSDI